MMRIAVATWTSRQVGGAETYLARTIAAFVAEGHELLLCYESDDPDDRPRFAVPPTIPTVCVSELGMAIALERLRQWQPDVIYVHVLNDVAFEEQLQSIAPAVLFAHAYYGTCISGAKTHRFPVIQPCTRRFGPACLALYYPRRCGGLRPSTFVADYLRQRRRLRLLGRYAAVLTHSEHMRQQVPATRCGWRTRRQLFDQDVLAQPSAVSSATPSSIEYACRTWSSPAGWILSKAATNCSVPPRSRMRV